MIWKKIPRYSKYEVSEYGKIRSIKGILKGHVDKRGYVSYSLTDDCGKATTVRAHVAVALAFHGPKPSDGHYALHWDDVKSNNCSKNIRWGTPIDNKKDEKRNGRANIGEVNGSARLTAVMVREIRKNYASGNVTYKELSSIYGVGVVTVCNIVRHQTWHHLDD